MKPSAQNPRKIIRSLFDSSYIASVVQSEYSQLFSHPPQVRLLLTGDNDFRAALDTDVSRVEATDFPISDDSPGGDVFSCAYSEDNQDLCAPIVEHINTGRTGHKFHPSVVGVQSNMRIMLACCSYECSN